MNQLNESTAKIAFRHGVIVMSGEKFSNMVHLSLLYYISFITLISFFMFAYSHEDQFLLHFYYYNSVLFCLTGEWIVSVFNDLVKKSKIEESKH